MKYLRLCFLLGSIFFVNSSYALKFNNVYESAFPVVKEMTVVHGETNKNCSQFQVYGFPEVNETAISKRGYYTCRIGYAGFYDPNDKVPLWIAEHLVKGQIDGEANRKNLSFSEDPQLPHSDLPIANIYRSSGWDKGHMAPAADFEYSEEAMRESFLYSNAIPQAPNNNRGIWANLEAAVREVAERRGELFVITGPIFTKMPHEKLRSDIAIPDEIFKVLIDPKTKTATAFVIPNINDVGNDYSIYQVSVRSLEKRVNLNFNPRLPKSESDKLEVSGGDWIMPKVRIKFKEQ